MSPCHVDFDGLVTWITPPPSSGATAPQTLRFIFWGSALQTHPPCVGAAAPPTPLLYSGELCPPDCLVSASILPLPIRIFTYDPVTKSTAY